MVNTFVVDQDFRVSASKLSNSHLGKQRSEAYQILIALNQLRFLAKYLNIPNYPIGIDTPKAQREAWIHNVISTFKQSGYSAILIRGDMLIHYRHGETLPRKPESGNKLLYDSVSDFIYEVKGVRQKIVAFGPKHTFVLPGEELITTGYRKHPAFCMWLGFEDCLKQYINAHIDVWISRGKNNTMKKYDVPENCPRPAWTLSADVINNFKCNLVNKEIKRNKPAWYLNQLDFIETWVHSKDNANKIYECIKQLPQNEWYKYVDSNQLSLYGDFPGYIWQ
jgi:hypothetical protein